MEFNETQIMQWNNMYGTKMQAKRAMKRVPLCCVAWYGLWECGMV
jgi:hypothetical protein